MAMWNDIKRIDDVAQNVGKFVFRKDTAVAEAVLYKYPDYKTRTVICCSTQSGCPVGCRFCGAGDYFVRSLTADEIVSQPAYLLDRVLEDEGTYAEGMGRLQIMFMSMGEPMLNPVALHAAIYALYRDYPRAALLVSTSAPRAAYGPFRELSKAVPTVGLQFSVHESTDEARDALIPLKGKLCLAEIAHEGELWHFDTGRQPFFNYCAHEGNTSDADAERLLNLFNPHIWQCTVSVVCERDESVAAANARQRELATSFMAKMMARGYSTRCFDPAGQDDIGGGCGQLWFVQDWMQKHPHLAKASVGKTFPIVHAPRVAA